MKPAAAPRLRVVAAMLAAATLLAACGSALSVIGPRHAAAPAPQPAPQPRQVALKLHAGESLNADASGTPLALTARIYKLRQAAAFEKASYSAFLDPRAEREQLGADIVEAREVTLVPGQRYEVTETLAPEVSHVGVVALFRKPAPQRWRAAFAAADAERAGVTVGLHACALSVGQGAAGTALKPLAGARCQP